MNEETTSADLQAQIDTLRARLDDIEAGRTTLGPITCSSLTVVGADGNRVAYIDANGAHQCRSLLVIQQQGFSLSFNPPFAALTIKDHAGREVASLNDHGTGTLTLRQPTNLGNEAATLAPGRMIIFDADGVRAVDANIGSAGGLLTIAGKGDQQHVVTLKSQPGVGGLLILTDPQGCVTAQLPTP